MWRLLAVATLLVAPALGTAVVPATASAAASPVNRAQGAASFSEGKCTSGDSSSVTVVIDFQELGGGTVIRCGHGLSAGANGIAAMRAAAISFDGNARYGQSFVCRILGRPSASEPLPIDGGGYREKCINTSPAKAYWSYWQASENGSWVYSTLGIAASKARLGGFEGWSFSLNKTDSTNPPPRVDTALAAPAPTPTTRPASPTTARPTTARPTPVPPATVRPTTVRPTTSRPTSAPAASRPTDTQPNTPPPTAPPATADDPGAGSPAEPTAAAPASDPSETAAGTQPDAAASGTAVVTTGAGQPAPSSVPSSSVTSSSASAGSPSRPSSSSGTSRSRSAGDPSSGSGVGTGRMSSAPVTSGLPSSATSAADSPDPVAAENLASEEVEPDASSPWPVIAVLALALVGGGAAFMIARRRRGDGV